MSKKDYLKFAKMIHDQFENNRNSAGSPEVLETIQNTAVKIADILQEDNPNFNRDRFLTACL